MDEVACVNDSIAHCVEGCFVLAECGTGLVYVLPAHPDDMGVMMLKIAQVSSNPMMGSSGTAIGCVAVAKNNTPILATRATSPNDSSQASLCLDPSVVSTGFEDHEQGNITGPGQGLFHSGSIVSTEYRI